MRKTLWTLLLLWGSSALKGLQTSNSGHMELTRLKMSLMYVRSIKTFRLLFISLLGIGVCLVFLFVGLILFHVSLFLYAPWSMETKMLLGLFCSVVYLMATFIMFSRIFASDKWLNIFHADTIMDHLREEALQKDSIEPTQQR
jgi:hypothetical protein